MSNVLELDEKGSKLRDVVLKLRDTVLKLRDVVVKLREQRLGAR